jgi:hypothetical protein
MSFLIGNHLCGQQHVRSVQAQLRALGGDRAALTQVAAMGWLPLEGGSFNVVLGVYAPHVPDVIEERGESEVGGDGEEGESEAEWERATEFSISDILHP